MIPPLSPVESLSVGLYVGRPNVQRNIIAGCDSGLIARLRRRNTLWWRWASAVQSDVGRLFINDIHSRAAVHPRSTREAEERKRPLRSHARDVAPKSLMERISSRYSGKTPHSPKAQRRQNGAHVGDQHLARIERLAVDRAR